MDLPENTVRANPSNPDTENSQKEHIIEKQHARDLKFKKHLPCVAFHKFGAAILKILLFGRHFWPKIQYGRHFWLSYGQKAKFSKSLIKCVEYHTGKVGP